MKRSLSFTALVLSATLLAAPSADADEGRGLIPVGPSGFIDSPGHYVLTDDLDDDAGSALIVASDGVTVDLNRKTITVTDPLGAGIVVGIASGSLSRGITIRNGSIVGGRNGISASAPDGGRIRIEGVSIAGQSASGIRTDGLSDLEIVGCSVADAAGTGIQVSQSSGNVRIADNVVRGVAATGIAIGTAGHASVVGNHVSQTGLFGIAVTASSSRIVDNQIDTAAGASGISVWSGQHVIAENTVSFAQQKGIFVHGDAPSSFVLENEVFSATGDGIAVHADGCLIDRNHVTGGGAFGIYVQAITTPTAYRNNVLRDNAAGPVGEFTASSGDDLGGNICDGACP